MRRMRNICHVLLVMLVVPACEAGVRMPPGRSVGGVPAQQPAGRTEIGHPQAAAVVVRVDPRASLGPLPRLFRPSAMLAWADAEAVQAFLGLPGPFGTVRLSVEPLLLDASAPDQYLASLARAAPRFKALADHGAELVVVIARMPRWLASRQDESQAGSFGFSVREASPPRDYKAFEQFIYDTVRVVNRDHGLSPLYEFWSEPNSRSFWVGTQAELFQTYAAFAAGARRADPKAKVGGLAVGSWADRREGEPDASPRLLEAFVRYARGRRLPVDFVSWHSYGSSPEEGWEGVAEIQRWLGTAGLSPSLPQVVTEWNRWATFPEWSDPSRDGALGAAYIPAALQAMDRTGVTLQTFASLQDFNPARPGAAFIGDFGLLTRSPVVKKAAFHVVNMLALLEGARIQVSVPPEIVDAEGLEALGTTGPGRVVVLLHRFGGDPFGALTRSLRRSGYRRVEDLGISAERAAAFVRRESELSPTEASPPVRQALERARSLSEKARDAPTPQIAVRLQIQDWAGPIRYKIYRVDAEHGNPAEAYRAARGKGQGHENALRAAQQQETFAPWVEGTGALPELRLGRYAVLLVVVERPKRP